MHRELRRLYYIKGMVPTEEEKADAARLGMICFRNGAVAEKASYLEPADEVAGYVPAGYLEMKGCRILERPKTTEKAGK